MVEIEHIVCPLCAYNRVLNSKRKGMARFDLFDGSKPIIQIRDAPGGKIPNTGLGKGHGPGTARAKGFPMKEGLYLSDIGPTSPYYPILGEIYKNICRIKELFERYGFGEK